MKPFPLRRAVPMTALLLVASLARVICLLDLREDLSVRVPLLDAKFYLDLAVRLAHGEGWPSGPHFMAPLYPLLLSGLFRLAPPAVETVQWAQLVLGVGTTALVFLAARRIEPRAALVAGLLYALSAPVVIYENQVLMESTLAFLLAAVLVLTGEGVSPTLPKSALAGLAIGAAAIGRPSYSLVLPAFLILGAGRDGRRWWKAPAPWAALVGFGLMVAPPSLHNLRATGQPSLVTVSGGLNLYIGNNPAAQGVYSEPPGLFLEKDITGASSASRMAGRTLDPAEASRFFAAQAWRYMREQPGDAIALWIRKARYLVSPVEIPQIESVDELRAAYLPLRLLTPFGFAVFLPLAVLGGVRWMTRRRTVQMALAVVLSGALTQLVFFSTGRYRAAMMPGLAVLAGGGIAELVECFRSRQGFLRAGWPLALGLGLMLLSPRVDRNATRAWALHQAGVRYDQLGAARAAEESYRQALALDPTSGESWHNLAVIEAKEGRIAEAIEDNERALRVLGEHPLTLYNLGILYGRMGMDEKAIAYLERSLARDPRDPAVRVDHAVALYRLGRQEEAFREWRAVAADDPRDPSLKRTLNRILSLGATLPDDLLRIARGS